MRERSSVTLVAAGVMNLWVIAGLTLVVMIEKLAPFGRQISRVTGIVLIAVAFGLFTR
jgi:predicted metal-binding membrane protein